MTFDSFATLVVFAGVLVCTPGPANMLLMTAGANAGLRASFPLLAGVTLGKLFVHLCLALGLWQIIERFPVVLLVMKVAGACYIVWLAWKVLHLKIKKGAMTAGFFAGLVVHPLNPKAWAMVASAYGQFIDADSGWWLQTFIIAVVFFFWQCIAHTFWCWSGATAAHALGERRQTQLMFVLSAAMVGAVLWSLAH